MSQIEDLANLVSELVRRVGALEQIVLPAPKPEGHVLEGMFESFVARVRAKELTK